MKVLNIDGIQQTRVNKNNLCEALLFANRFLLLFFILLWFSVCCCWVEFPFESKIDARPVRIVPSQSVYSGGISACLRAKKRRRISALRRTHIFVQIIKHYSPSTKHHLSPVVGITVSHRHLWIPLCRLRNIQDFNITLLQTFFCNWSTVFCAFSVPFPRKIVHLKGKSSVEEREERQEKTKTISSFFSDIGIFPYVCVAAN